MLFLFPKVSVSSLLILLLSSYNYSFAQVKSVTASGVVRAKANQAPLPYVNVVLLTEKDSTFVSGTVSNDEGRFTLTNIKPGNYLLSYSFIGYTTFNQSFYVGSLSNYLDLATIELEEDSQLLNEVVITGQQDAVNERLDKKTFTVADNISQSGGSVLQAMQNLPGVTVQDGKILIRGNDKVTVLIDGKQTALTGFGNQSGLDNLPASAIEKIEIINNPSAKYDANGNAGIINIIYKANKQKGFNGKAGFAAGAGALWVRKENLPTIRPQYQFTPKINPSLSLNYKKNRINAFLQGDYLYTETLNKNEFVTRTYDDGSIVRQQTKRNRDTGFTTLKAGTDYTINNMNTLTLSGLFGYEKIIDRGDEPFFNADLSERTRLWQFLEDEIKITVMATAAYQHRFQQPGHLLNIGFNYTFHREDEQYFFDNILPSYSGKDAFKLLSDESVYDFNIDYVKPFRYGRLESGVKLRKRDIPTNMEFFPSAISPIDVNAGGWANYKELIPALYSNYIYESKKIEAEIGLRAEYVDLNYQVNPNHNTYKSDGYSYAQPFPNVRLAYKFNDDHKLSLFFNRRVDRPNEVDIRIFPKYDDVEIIKVGNPGLQPQFTNVIELGYKTNWEKAYLFMSGYHRFADATITRIASSVPGSNLIYAIFQNAGKSYNTGIEVIYNQEVSNRYSFNLNTTIYRNQINAFTVQNLYPSPNTFSAELQEMFSGNIKWNNMLRLPKALEAQISIVYLAGDLIPQGEIAARYSVDLGMKKQLQKGNGELFFNVTDLFNTLVIKKVIQGDGFSYTSDDYYETQVVRLGYSYKF
ncbi:MAG TPA: TonB-dependent receptor [Cytophagales bacterium]|nr:TonB-dependent receptor [Cytophagales bacterium]